MPEDLDNILQTDPLGELARKQRKSLLLASVIAYAVVGAELIPSKIAALGLEISQIDRRAFLIIVLLAVFYFFVFFLLYSIPDVLGWWKRYSLLRFEQERQSRLQEIQDFQDPSSTEDPPESEGFPQVSQSYRLTEAAYRRSVKRFRRAVLTKVFFDLVIPILAGLVALIFVLLKGHLIS